MEHKHYALCLRAYRNTSFTPEVRAENCCAYFDANQVAVKELSGDEAKHERLFVAWMTAQSRCASSMVVGPANFPMARIEKANASERHRSDEYHDYITGLKQQREREAFYEANPDARPISSDDPSAVERLRTKLVSRQAVHDAMLAANKSKPGTHQPFELSNSKATLKRLADRITVLEKRTQLKHVEVRRDGFRVIQNVAANRIQIIFDAVPDYATRKRLKKLAFKWAPTQNAWQRQFTNAAVYAAKQFMSAEGQQ